MVTLNVELTLDRLSTNTHHYTLKYIRYLSYDYGKITFYCRLSSSVFYAFSVIRVCMKSTFFLYETYPLLFTGKQPWFVFNRLTEKKIPIDYILWENLTYNSINLIVTRNSAHILFSTLTSLCIYVC